jgi:adenylate kinase
VRLLLLGPPGAGKGTQGARLADALEIQHIAAGDVLRAEVARKSAVGLRAGRFLRAGELAPDDLIIDALMSTLVAAAARGGYILDGFPRTAPQARALDAVSGDLNIPLEAAVYLDVHEDELMRRLLARAEIEGRSDDTPDVIARRLHVFGETTRPLIKRYEERGLLVTVDGTRSVDEITHEIQHRLTAGVGEVGAVPQRQRSRP